MRNTPDSRIRIDPDSGVHLARTYSGAVSRLEACVCPHVGSSANVDICLLKSSTTGSFCIPSVNNVTWKQIAQCSRLTELLGLAQQNA